MAERSIADPFPITDAMRASWLGELVILAMLENEPVAAVEYRARKAARMGLKALGAVENTAVARAAWIEMVGAR